MSRVGDEIETTVDVVVAEIEMLSGDRHAVTLAINGRSYSVMRGDVLTLTRPVKATAVIREIDQHAGLVELRRT